MHFIEVFKHKLIASIIREMRPHWVRDVLLPSRLMSTPKNSSAVPSRQRVTPSSPTCLIKLLMATSSRGIGKNVINVHNHNNGTAEEEARVMFRLGETGTLDSVQKMFKEVMWGLLEAIEGTS